MKLGFLAVFLILLTLTSQPNCWRGITPLRSTCEDVKRILNIDSCAGPESSYTLPDFRVSVEFAKHDCNEAPRAWRVAKGTVVALTVSPRKEMTPKEFGLDLSKFKKREDGEIVGLVHYDSEEDGIRVDLYRGFVQNLFLYPRKADETLRCKPAG